MSVDRYLFEKNFSAFLAFVERKSEMAFESFASNSYTYKQEGYKPGVWAAGRRALGFEGWKESELGNGTIISSVIRAIEFKENNLVQWQARFGEEKRPHQALYEAREDEARCRSLEECLFGLYRQRSPEERFDSLVDHLGKQYPVVAYLYFLRDCSKFLPIVPTYFEQAFELLGVSFKARGKCSRSNYEFFLATLSEVRDLLGDKLASHVSMLDAHSFAYMLARQMKEADALPDVGEYEALPPKEREAVRMARVGQGAFRDALIDAWGGCCAVTELREVGLLIASHIIPWRVADVGDCRSADNGLLLAPHLDAAFDRGWITFKDDGRIKISDRLKASDAEALGLSATMRLRRVTPGHKRTLSYHRESVFGPRGSADR